MQKISLKNTMLQGFIRLELPFIIAINRLKNGHKKKQSTFKAAVLMVVLCAVQLLCPACNSQKYIIPNPPQTSSQEQKDIQIPVRLKIPKIKVDAVIEPVGLTADGAMDVPKKLCDVAWYKLGPRPGEQGSAVFSGHQSHKASIPAVFDNLKKLSVGDCLYVEDELGQPMIFTVREIRIYNNGDGAELVFNRSDSKYLNLITCTGQWNEEQKTFDKRLVVFTEALNNPP